MERTSTDSPTVERRTVGVPEAAEVLVRPLVTP